MLFVATNFPFQLQVVTLQQLRFILVTPQHVIIRGNNRKPIFYAEEEGQALLINQACPS